MITTTIHMDLLSARLAQCLAIIALSISWAPLDLRAEQNGTSEDIPLPRLVRDINPGEASSVPDMFVRSGAAVYFRANDGAHGMELWRTDGTAEGTRLVIDLLPGNLGGIPGNLTSLGNSLYFHGFTEPTGSKVFRSDGTAAGTQLLVDTFPGAPGGPGGPPLPAGFTELGGRVLFAATDATHGYELWITDGTAAGTMLVKDIHPGQQWSVPLNLTPLGGGALFAADDSVISNPDGTATFDRELFVTDGTPSGTSRLLDINPGPQASVPFFLTRLGQKILFRANDGVHGAELWTSDGTAPGTRLLVDINPSGESVPMHLTFAGRRVFFSANDGIHATEPWMTDGEADTRLLKDINPTGPSSPLHFTPLGDRLIFTADDGQSGIELWITDGTEAGTQLVRDINPGIANSSPLEFAVAGDRLFFNAIVDLDDATKTVRTQLWMTDGTTEGTTLIWEAPGRATGYAIRHLTVLGDQLLFSAPTTVDAEGRSADVELYSLDIGSRW